MHTLRRQEGASRTTAAGALASQSRGNSARKQGAVRRTDRMDASTAQPAFPVIKAPFYLTLARRGQYLRVKAANDGTGMLDVLTAEASYSMTPLEKDKADRQLASERDCLKDTQPGRAFLCAVELALTGKEGA